jgi:hypothetical protein
MRLAWSARLDENEILSEAVRLSFGAATAERGKLPEAVRLADQRMYADKTLWKLKE